MIRPWYRSVLCWLGIPGLLFLLWAWGSSNVVRWFLHLPGSSVGSTQGKLLWVSRQSDVLHDLQVDYQRGEIRVRSLERVEGPAARRAFITYQGRPWTVAKAKLREGDPCWFPSAHWRAEEISRDTRYRLVSLPYWLLTMGYAGLWLGGVGWNQRRKSRLLKLPAAPLP